MLLCATLLSVAAARKPERRGGKQEEPTTWAEFAWNGVKFCFAMSPLIAIGAVLFYAQDDEEAEDAKRKRAKENGGKG